MAEKMVLWTLRYRGGIAGVKIGFIEAAVGQQEKVGKAYCALEPNRKFVGVERAVLYTQADMEEAMTAPAVAPAVVRSPQK
jgi:hypothetical protein